MNKGTVHAEARHVDSCIFKETELSNPDKDQDLESSGSEDGAILKKFQQHTRVLPITQERLKACLKVGQGLPTFETNLPP